MPFTVNATGEVVDPGSLWRKMPGPSYGGKPTGSINTRLLPEDRDVGPPRIDPVIDPGNQLGLPVQDTPLPVLQQDEPDSPEFRARLFGTPEYGTDGELVGYRTGQFTESTFGGRIPVIIGIDQVAQIMDQRNRALHPYTGGALQSRAAPGGGTSYRSIPVSGAPAPFKPASTIRGGGSPSMPSTPPPPGSSGDPNRVRNRQAIDALYPGPAGAPATRRWSFTPPGVPPPVAQYNYNADGSVSVPGVTGPVDQANYSSDLPSAPRAEEQRLAELGYATGRMG